MACLCVFSGAMLKEINSIVCLYESMTQLQQKFIFYSFSDQTRHLIQSLLTKTDSRKNGV